MGGSGFSAASSSGFGGSSFGSSGLSSRSGSSLGYALLAEGAMCISCKAVPLLSSQQLTVDINTLPAYNACCIAYV